MGPGPLSVARGSKLIQDEVTAPTGAAAGTHRLKLSSARAHNRLPYGALIAAPYPVIYASPNPSSLFFNRSVTTPPALDPRAKRKDPIHNRKCLTAFEATTHIHHKILQLRFTDDLD